MEKYVLERCLKAIGLHILAKDVLTQENWNVLDKYAKAAYYKALKEKRHDIIDDLELASLIYG